MKTKLLLFLSIVFIAVSCQKYDADSPVNVLNNAEDDLGEGYITLERALSNADFVYKNMEGYSYKQKRVRSVEVITGSRFEKRIDTRTESSIDDEDLPLAYVVNYENDGGYAILAADVLLPPIISLGDEGNFSTTDFVDFITNSPDTRSTSNLNPVQEVQYAIISNSLSLLPFDFDIDLDLPIIGHDTTMLLKCMPLVPVKWNQGNPYNYFAPFDVSENAQCLAGCVPVAGAQTLASLCYHHNFRPETQISSDYPVDWYTINKVISADTIRYTSGMCTPGSMAVASLIRAVGQDIDADYGVDATSGYTSRLVGTFDKLGLISARYGNIDAISREDIFDMIVVKNYPVPARASRLDEEEEQIGHAFVLDGWLRLEYTRYGFSASEGADSAVIADRPDSFQHSFDLVHVNFGWGGNGDGYYLPDAFDLTNNEFFDYAEEEDNPYVSTRNYNLGVGYLIYDL